MDSDSMHNQERILAWASPTLSGNILNHASKNSSEANQKINALQTENVNKIIFSAYLKMYLTMETQKHRDIN